MSVLKPPATILYEDNHLMIVNKRVSHIVQGDKTGDASLDQLLKGFIKDRDNKPGEVFLGIPHRLDRPVSGAVVFAKTARHQMMRLSSCPEDYHHGKEHGCFQSYQNLFGSSSKCKQITPVYYAAAICCLSL